jgi:DNA-binding GntR family transcriptional regulator
MTKRPRTKAKIPARIAADDKPRLTGAQRVYAALRHAIVALDIEPGAALEEERLCREYQVSRTPMREALIRLASEGLVELEPNRGAKVATLQFIDVVDHYEAMDVFQPVIWHFAAVRRTNDDLAAIKERLEAFRVAVAREDTEAIVRSNYEVHKAIAAACRNRSLEKAYRQMLVDKLRVSQHAIRGLARDRGRVLATRITGALKILERLVAVIAAGDGRSAERLARDYNGHVREQIVDILSTSLAGAITLPRPRDNDPTVSVSASARALQSPVRHDGVKKKRNA